ncbi:hypothetical protein J2X14_000507 [Pantoea alhagi]|uniref:hypothetical protein n=1 Tax=Mixta sp. BE291 TaxID=3158787 RepID=UPI002856EF3B|nr:hypothetical protein [Pantoea alhagi]
MSVKPLARYIVPIVTVSFSEKSFKFDVKQPCTFSVSEFQVLTIDGKKENIIEISFDFYVIINREPYDSRDAFLAKHGCKLIEGNNG